METEMGDQKTKSWFFTDREMAQGAMRKWPAHLTLEQQRAQLQHEIQHEIKNGIAARQ
jgi:hypothetical protein